MIKTRNILLVFLLIVIQSAFAITAGVTALFGMSLKTVPTGVYAGEVSIGGMQYSDAANAVETSYGERFERQALLLEVDKGVIYEIPFSQIDANIDGNATVSILNTPKG